MNKITRVKFENHPVLNNCEINLVDKKEFNEEEYLTFIIGQNGTGKSKLLMAIVEFLIKIQKLSINPKYKLTVDYGIELDIFQNGVIHTFKYYKDFEYSSTVKKDLNEIMHDNIIVSAYTFNDKFTFSENDEFYKYCGLRTTSNNIFVNVPFETTFINLTEIIFNEDKLKVTNIVFEELNLKRKVTVFYKLKNNKVYNNPKFKTILNEFKISENISLQSIELFKSIILSTIGRSKLKNYKISRFISNNEDVKKLLEFLFNNLNLHSFNRLSFCWEDELTVNEIDENIIFKDNIEFFKILREIGVFQFDKFLVYRNESFDFSEASSGEFHFLSLFTSILSNIRENSLVIIDEPEISLHPNWQNKLIDTLRPMFESYPKAQFIIASHSHLMVSSLKGEKSSLISMKINGTGVEIKNHNKINTYGWSAEQILFDVFGMVTDRNYYLSLKLQEIITEMASLKPNKTLIEKNIEELKSLDLSNLNPKDPFKIIIDNILK